MLFRSQQVTSLNRALIMLGLNTIKNIALSSAVVEASGKESKNKHFDLHDLWLHMLAVGVANKSFAKAAGQSRQALEEYFIAGLLHDIGDMMLMKYLPDEYHAAVEHAGLTQKRVVEACRELLGLTGPEIGVQIGGHWKLPENLVQCIAAQETPPANPSPLVKMILFADRHCRSAEIGYTCDKLGCDNLEADLQGLGLSAEAYRDAAAHLPEELEKAKVFLKS